jgi:hypothetical protein
MGGFFSVAMAFAVTSGLGDVVRWFERASMRWDAEVGMRVYFAGKVPAIDYTRLQTRIWPPKTSSGCKIGDVSYRASSSRTARW